MGHPVRVSIVIGILETVVWLHRCWVGEMHPGACFHRSVDKPVPGGGRCDDHARDVCLIRSSLLQNSGQMIGEASVLEHLVLLIEEHDHTVVCMQIDPAVEWHPWLLLGFSGCSSALQPYWSARLRSLLDDYQTVF